MLRLLSAKTCYPIEGRTGKRRRELAMISINRVVEKEQQCDEHPIVNLFFSFNLEV
jgi:hypothetical protein